MDEDFWRPKSDLKQQFHERLLDMGATDLGRGCIESFFEMDGAKLWRPEKVLLGQVAKVIDIGLLLSILGLSNLPKDYKERIDTAIKSDEKIPADLWSELIVAALLKHYGASVEFVPRSSSKTPDFSCSWDGQPAFDVEVTRGKMKAWHIAVQQGLNDFVDALAPGDVDWHILCFVRDGSDKKLLGDIFDAAVKLRPGERAEQKNDWSVVAVPLADREIVLGGQSTELLAPTWWPQNEGGFITNATLLNEKSNPVVALRSLVPQASYINPIKRKAEHGQHSSGRPYIIALDAGELPRAMDRLPADVERDFPIWTHVSGVLIVSPLFYVTSTKKEFKFRLLANPYADWKMPSQLLDLSAAPANTITFEICT